MTFHGTQHLLADQRQKIWETQKTMSQKNWVKMGTVGAPHGIRGAFFCIADDRRSEGFNHRTICLSRPSHSGSAVSLDLTLARSFSSGGKLVLQTHELKSRLDAEKWRGADVLVLLDPRQLEPEEIFVRDLIGTTVCDPDGRKLGEVIAVHEFGAGHENLEIRRDPEKPELDFFFPFLKQFVLQHDLTTRTLMITGYEEFLP